MRTNLTRHSTTSWLTPVCATSAIFLLSTGLKVATGHAEPLGKQEIWEGTDPAEAVAAPDFYFLNDAWANPQVPGLPESGVPLAVAPQTTQTLYTWQGGAGSNDWSTGSNWFLGNAPSNDGTATVAFSATSSSADLTSNVDVNYTINELYYGGTQTFTLASDADQGLVILGGGISQNSSAAQNIDLSTYLRANQTWNFGNNTGALNFNTTLYVSNAATLTFSGGTVNATSLQIGRTYAGPTGTNGTVTQTGGVFQVGTLHLGDDSFAESGMGSAPSNGTYNLNGGTLSVGTVRGLNGVDSGGSTTLTNAQAVLNLGNGVLQATGNTTDFIDYITSIVATGNASIDTQGYNVTLLMGITDPAGASGGDVTKIGSGTLTLLATNTAANVTVSAGTLTLGNQGQLAGVINFLVDGTNPGSTVCNLLAGSGINASEIYVGHSFAGGTLDMSGGLVDVSLITLDGQTSNIFTQSGGSNRPRFLEIGGVDEGSNATSTYNLQGGALQTAYTYIGEGQSSVPGIFNQTGGTQTVTGELYFGYQNTTSAGIYNLDGGTLNVSTIAQNTGTGTFNFNGGTLQAGASNVNFLQGLSVAEVRNGGAIIDTNGYNDTVAQGLVHSNIAGDNAIDGGLTKLGLGTLTLSGTNSFTGPVDATNGTLAITGSVGSGGAVAFTVAGPAAGSTAAATVSGSGAITASSFVVGSIGAGTFTQSGTSTVSASQFLAIGNDDGNGSTGAGTYNLQGGALTAPTIYVGDSNTSTPSVFNQTAGTATVSGALQFGYQNTGSAGTYELDGGILGVAQVLQNAGNGTFDFDGGTLRAGASSTSFFQGLTTANVQTGGAIIDTQANSITIAQALLHDTTSGAPATDGGLTKLGSGALTLTGNNTYLGGTTVSSGQVVELNNGNALSTGTVSIAQGATVALSNTTGTTVSQENITFTGAGTLQKTGAGTVQLGGNGGNVNISLSPGGLIDVESGTLAGSSAYDGIYTNNEGGLYIASGATFNGEEGTVRVDALTGAGTLQGGYSNTGSVTIGVNNGSGTFSGVIADSGNTGGVLTLIKAGSGTETLTGTNTYTGTTTISAGALQIGSGGGSGSLGTSGVVDNAALVFDRSNAISVSNMVSGTGSLTQEGVGTLSVTGANTYNGGTTLAGGTLSVGSAGALGTSGTLSFTGGTLQYSAANTTDYSGRFSTAANQAYSVDTNGQNVTFASALTSTGGTLTKLGAGTLSLTSNNDSYSGPTTIDAGTLLVDGINSGGGAVTVQGSGSVLGGTGTLKSSVNVTTGGALNPGNNAGAAGSAANVGTLTLVGSLALSSTATGVFDVSSGSTYDKLVDEGNVSLRSATLTLDVGAGATFTGVQTLDLVHVSGGTLIGTFANFTDLGTYTYGGETFEAVYTPTDFELVTINLVVPEPATWSWLLLGTAAMAGVVTRRRH